MRWGSGWRKRRSLLLALAAAAGLVPVRAGAEITFSRREPITTQLTEPGAVAVDAAREVYVSEAGRNRVVIFDALGASRRVLSGLDRPISLAVDAAGRVFVGNAGRRNVEIYGPDLTLQGKLGSGDGEFGQPSGIAVDGAGFVYVADSKENLVKVYRPDGTRQSDIGGGTGTEAIFQFPVALAVNDAAGEIVVTDLRDSLSSHGTYGGARVQVFTKGGALVRSFGNYGRGEGLLIKPLGVTTDGGGKVYVTDAFQNVVQVFDQAGAYLGTMHDAGHPLRTPLGIAFSGGSGKVYVCSLTAGRVETFDVSPPMQSVTLTVTTAGNGQGTVTSAPAGISCPGVCSAVFPAGSAVTLAAQADAGFSFAGWSGSCVGAGDCALNLSQDLDAVSHFEASTPTRRVPSDFNGDGLSDVLWLDKTGHQVAIWLVDRELQPHASPVASAQRQILRGTADVSGDGKADILWHSRGGAVSLWSMAGATIGAANRVGARKDPGWGIAGLADFDGDGHADVLWRHDVTGVLRLWLMAGNAVGADRMIGTVKDPQWQIAGLADFDGDGSADILLRHAITKALQIWYMKGAKVQRRGGLQGQQSGVDAEIAGVGDFDGDGRADILWRATTGGFSYWPLANDEAAAAVVLANSPVNRWRLLRVGDYDGDGRADLLLRHRVSNEVGACLSADATTLRCISLGAAPGFTAGE